MRALMRRSGLAVAAAFSCWASRADAALVEKQITVEAKITSGVDDLAQQNALFFPKTVILDNEAIDIAFGGLRLAALRFTDLAIPSDAVIDTAVITLTSSVQDNVEATSVVIRADVKDEPFEAEDNEISNFIQNTPDVQVDWEDLPLLAQDEEVDTSDVSILLQRLVDDAAEATQGGDIVFVNNVAFSFQQDEIFQGNRRLVTFEADPEKAAVLVVTFTVIRENFAEAISIAVLGVVLVGGAAFMVKKRRAESHHEGFVGNPTYPAEIKNDIVVAEGVDSVTLSEEEEGDVQPVSHKERVPQATFSNFTLSSVFRFGRKNNRSSTTSFRNDILDEKGVGGVV
mmetsp:Transcript_3936/g.6920  ORF Transcript_3936/g.6920 Transcript_3936/m.6920 type:complete len:342 (-) Transcript_3936:73-1098(-)